MAEFLLRHHLGPETSWHVASAGTFAVDGMAASYQAIEALREKGIDLTPHRSRMLTNDIIDSAALIVVMTRQHAQEIRRRFVDAQARIRLLKSFDQGSNGGDVPDPLGCNVDAYRNIRDEIDASLLDVILHLQSHDTGDVPGTRCKKG